MKTVSKCNGIIPAAMFFFITCLVIAAVSYTSSYTVRRDVWEQLTKSPDSYLNHVKYYNWQDGGYTIKNGVLLVPYDNGVVAIRAHVDPITHRVISIDPGD